MKLLVIVIIAFLISSNFKSYSQTLYEDYQDGLVVFQLKEDIDVFSSDNKIVNYQKLTLFRKSLKDFEIAEVLRLHPRSNDNLLRRTYQIRLTNINQVNEVISILSKHSDIEYAELKELHYTTINPNDPGFSVTNQWGLFQIQAQTAWDFSTGNSNVVVAVTDNAINIDHPDLSNKMVPGRDVADNDNDPRPCGVNNGFHGSHVSGIVGADTDNNSGVASIGWEVSVMPVKIGRCSDGALIAGYEGVEWAASNGADVINMSWGGAGSSQYGQNICNYAWNQGSILIAAAGNDNQSTQLFPAAYNNVISVASTNQSDQKSIFSQYGQWIDISAPGSGILSTDHINGYQNSSGTSMASPLVAGLVGLMISHAPNATRSEIINCLYNGADDIDTQNPGFVGQLGAGRINAFNSLSCLNNISSQNDAAIVEIHSPNTILCSSMFTPEVVLVNFGSNTLSSVTIHYEWDNNPQVYNWTGNLSSGQTEVVSLPVQSANDGYFLFTASTSQPNGVADDNPMNDDDFSNMTVNFTTYTLPFQETFENNVFSSGRWSRHNPDNLVTWSLENVGGITPGSNAVKMDFYNYSESSRRDGLISPRIDLSGYTSAEMTFDHAFRRYDQSSTDSLIIYVSTDCGISYERVFQVAENGTGSFATQTTSTTVFTPSISDEWCFGGGVGASCFSVNLDGYVGQEIVLKFESYNSGSTGNNLFIDNININGVPSQDPPNPDFSVNISSICEGESVLFTDLSTSNITNWNWNFQGGTPSTSNAQNPTVIYDSSGVYDVSLEVSNSFGTETINMTDFIEVSPSPSVPVITQTGNVLSVILQSGESVEWLLNGNLVGTTSSITMTVNGNYTVLITNQFDCTSGTSGFYEMETTSLNDYNLSKHLVVYPNPSNGIINVNIKGVDRKLTLNVVDVIGRTVLDIRLNEKDTEIDLSTYGKGMYTLIFTGVGDQAIKRVLLE